MGWAGKPNSCSPILSMDRDGLAHRVKVKEGDNGIKASRDSR